MRRWCLFPGAVLLFFWIKNVMEEKISILYGDIHGVIMMFSLSNGFMFKYHEVLKERSYKTASR